jgi:septal ring factor EnvC (AmiA/AmiB activator)
MEVDRLKDTIIQQKQYSDSNDAELKKQEHKINSMIKELKESESSKSKKTLEFQTLNNKLNELQNCYELEVQNHNELKNGFYSQQYCSDLT